MNTHSSKDAAKAIAERPPRASILVKMAERFSVEPNKLLDTLKSTAFKSPNGVTNEQMIALLIVADQYGLNPFTKEVYAFPDKGGIVPVVGVDGWARIINEHQQFDGLSFAFDGEDRALQCTATIHRKDRAHPISVTEYMAECRRDTGPWKSHPRRMLRHKAMIQCARLAFGFAGIYDEDEAERVRHMGHVDEARPAGSSLATVQAAISERAQSQMVVDLETGEVSSPAEPPPAAFNYAAAQKRVAETADAEILALQLDEWRDLPDTPETHALVAAATERMRALGGL